MDRYPPGLARWENSLPGHGWRRANELGLVTQTLALGAQQVLCTAPLLVAASAVIRRVSQRDVGALLSRYLGLTGAAAKDVAALFAGSSSVGRTDLIVGVALAAFFGTGVAATQQRGFEMIWSLHRAGLRSTVRQLIWVVGLMAYLFVVLGVGRGAHHLHNRAHQRLLVRSVTQFMFSLLFYWWSQHLLLSGRVRWRRLLPGAACMAAGTTILVALSGLILPSQITEQVNDYGLIGAAFVLSVWLIVLSGVIFIGALLGAVIDERRQRPAETGAPAQALRSGAP
jgi:membrane protein